MASKTFTGLVIAFWLIMMTALVRMEFFPSPTNLTSVPVSRVLQKLFDNHEAQDLRVVYQGNEIGQTKIEITPLASPAAKPGEVFEGSPGGYRVKVNVLLNLNVFNTPSRFSLNTDSHFDARYEIKDYQVRTKLGESHVEIEGKNDTKKVRMSYDMGDGPTTREFDYAQLTGPGALTALGVPELSGFASFALPSARAGSAADSAAMHPVIHAYDDHLTLGGIGQHAYLVDFRSEPDPIYWVKIWVDDQGSILVVETSMGLTMRSSTIEAVTDNLSSTTEPTRTRPLQ